MTGTEEGSIELHHEPDRVGEFPCRGQGASRRRSVHEHAPAADRHQLSVMAGANFVGMHVDRDLAVVQSVVVGKIPADIVEAESRIRRAQLDADVSALDELISDELLFTGPTGEVGTKSADLEAHASGAVRFREHQPEELRARPVNDDVVVTAMRARLVVKVGGATVSGIYRYTRVWARENGKWRVVGGHVSEVR